MNGSLSMSDSEPLALTLLPRQGNYAQQSSDHPRPVAEVGRLDAHAIEHGEMLIAQGRDATRSAGADLHTA
jgi:hypothetical protein